MFNLEILGPITDGTLERWLRMEPRKLLLVYPVTDAKIKFTLNASTGFLKGSFIDVGTGLHHTLEGVAIQSQQSMGRYFRGLYQPGEFSITPLLR